MALQPAGDAQQQFKIHQQDESAGQMGVHPHRQWRPHANADGGVPLHPRRPGRARYPDALHAGARQSARPRHHGWAPWLSAARVPAAPGKPRHDPAEVRRSAGRAGNRPQLSFSAGRCRNAGARCGNGPRNRPPARLCALQRWRSLAGSGGDGSQPAAGKNAWLGRNHLPPGRQLPDGRG